MTTITDEWVREQIKGIKRGVASGDLGNGEWTQTMLTMLKEIERMRAELEQARQERAALREIIADCAHAVGGSASAEHSSLEFLQQVPEEVRLVVQRMKVIATLPKTADGVPVVQGMKVWASRNPNDSTLHCFVVCKDSAWASRRGGSSKAGAWLVKKCYSTREAAERAAKEAVEGES